MLLKSEKSDKTDYPYDKNSRTFNLSSKFQIKHYPSVLMIVDLIQDDVEL